MKLIKKIAAIMFAFMMVFSLSTNVKAEEGTGKIILDDIVEGQVYKVYQLFTLESYKSDSEIPNRSVLLSDALPDCAALILFHGRYVYSDQMRFCHI